MVKLYRQTLPKNPPPRQVAGKRSAKHKKANKPVKVTVDAMEVTEEANAAEEGMETESLTGSQAPRGLEIKEEHAAARKKANYKNNLYKRVHGNCTGKNGPRAINPQSISMLNNM
jgi:hypothetical protein